MFQMLLSITENLVCLNLSLSLYFFKFLLLYMEYQDPLGALVLQVDGLKVPALHFFLYDSSTPF